MTNEELSHIGILGMHWGKRKGSIQSTTNTGPIHPNADKVKGTIHALSDIELQQKISRIELERKYSLLTKKQLGPGEKFVKEMLNKSSQQLATTYMTKFMTQGVEALLKAAVKPTVKAAAKAVV